MFGEPVPRRHVLAAAAAVGVGWLPTGRLVRPAAGAQPDGLPAGIELFRREYRNWSGETRVEDVWTCQPGTPQDVVALANWAHRSGYTLRAQGFRHGWSPLTVTADQGAAARVVLVDTTAHLTAASVTAGPAGVPYGKIRAQAGVSMEALLDLAAGAGYGLVATPAPGDLTVGAVLAIDGHGTAVPADGESRAPGTTYGSLSNLVTSLTAVVWDPAAGAYTLRTLDRAEPGCAALLTHLGRAFVTEATLRVGADTNLRCVSRVDLSAAELFGPPGSGGTTLADLVARSGRVEAIWFAFTTCPWIKVWSRIPEPPLGSRPVLGPYNYPFSDNVPRPVAELAGRIVAGEYFLAPLLGQAQYDATAAGLLATGSADIWGASRNLLLYVRPTTLRVHANGYAVLTTRAHIQRVVHEFTTFYSALLAGYAERGSFPVNGALEIRVTGVDDPGDVEVRGAATPALSAVRPVAGHPEWDVAVWFDVLTLPGTPRLSRFYRDVERFVVALGAAYGMARVEWSKGWAYTAEAAWSDPAVIGGVVPGSFPPGPPSEPGSGSGPVAGSSIAGWAQAVAALDEYDPQRVFSNPFLDVLLR